MSGFKITINAVIERDDKTICRIDGYNSYIGICTGLKEYGAGHYCYQNKLIPFPGHIDINKRSLVANITDKIMTAFQEEIGNR